MSDVRVHYLYRIPTYVDTTNLSMYVRTYLRKYMRTYLCMNVQMLDTHVSTYITDIRTYVDVRESSGNINI